MRTALRTTLLALAALALTASNAHAIGFTLSASIRIPSVSSLKIASGDLDGDGDPDVIVSRGGPGALDVLINDGRGGLFRPSVRSLGNDVEPRRIAVADLDGDGRADVAGATSNGLFVSHSNGDGTLAAPTNVPMPDARGLAVVDLDGDGRPELVVTGADGSVSVVTRGPSGWTATTAAQTAGAPGAVVSGDFDSDGRVDVATAVGTTVAILWGDGRGGLSAPTTIATRGTVHALAAGDLDGDGRTDIAVSIMPPYWFELGVIVGGTDRSPVLVSPLHGLNNPLGGDGIAAGSVDADGFTDLVTTAQMFRGGPLTYDTRIVPVPFAWEYAVADFDGDGLGDIAGLVNNQAQVWLAGPAFNRDWETSQFNVPASAAGGIVLYDLPLVSQEPTSLRLGDVRLSGPDAGLFELRGCANSVLAARGSCTIRLVYHPTAESVRRKASLHISVATELGPFESDLSITPGNYVPTVQLFQTSPARITGVPQAGQTLTCDVGGYDIAPSRREYVWHNSEQPLAPVATTQTFTPKGSDIGEQFFCSYFAGVANAGLSGNTGAVTIAAGEVERTAPDVTLAVGPAPRVSGGVPFSLTCSKACRVSALLLADRATLKRAGVKTRLKWTTVGRADAKGAAGQQVAVAPRLDPKLARRFAKLKSFKLTLDVRVVDGRGNARRLSRRVTLQR